MNLQEKTAEACLCNHGADLVGIASVSFGVAVCNVCKEQFAANGFKCDICPHAYYCTPCKNLDAKVKQGGGIALSVVADDMDLDGDFFEIQQSEINFDLGEKSEMRPDIVRQHHYKTLDSVTSSVILGLAPRNKREEKGKEKEEKKQERLERDFGVGSFWYL